MGDTNYIASIVKILENPITKIVGKRKIVTTECRVQLPQVRNTRIVNLVFWGKLASDVAEYYKINDYIMIEGFLSLRNRTKSNVTKKNSKKTQITVSKLYPFLLNSNR